MSLNLDTSKWTRVVFGTVAQASKEKVDPLDGSVERYVAGEHMDTDDLKIHRWGEVGDGYLGPAFHRRFHPGQVLYGSRRTYLRKVALAEFDGVCANTTFVVETKDFSRLSPEFLPFIMTSEPFHAFAIAESKGSVNPYVNWSDIERYQFDLPPLDEQNLIADLLWAVESERVSLDELRAGAALVRQTWIDSMVSGFVHSQARPFESIWSRSPEGGRSAAPVDESTGRYVLSLAALGPDGYRQGHLKNVPDTEAVRAAALRPGDLLISRANTLNAVGRVGIYSEDRTDVSFPDTMMRVSLIDGLEPEFCAAVVSSQHGRTHMRRSAAGSATSMVKINRGSLGRLAFPIVERAEREAFLAKLSQLNSAVDAIDRERAALIQARAALLNDVYEGH